MNYQKSITALLLFLMVFSFSTQALSRETMESSQHPSQPAMYDSLLDEDAGNTSDKTSSEDISAKVARIFDSENILVCDEPLQPYVVPEIRQQGEREPNNTLVDANIINNYYYGQYEYMINGWINDSYDDVDLFRITTAFEGDLVALGKWTGSFEGYDWEEDLGIFLLNAAGDILLASVPIIHEDTEWSAFAVENLPAGTYYLAVLQLYGEDDLYVGQRYLLDFGFFTEGCHVTLPRAPGSGTYIGFLNEPYIVGTTRDTICTEGHAVHHQIDLGDGTITSWMNGISAEYRWSEVGTYQIRVRARCATNPTVVTEWVDGMKMEIRTPCQLPTPVLIDPPVSGDIFSVNTFTAETQVCSSGHPLEYRFDWSLYMTAWYGSNSVSQKLTVVGQYPIRVQTRCKEFNQFESEWSEPAYIDITAPLLQLTTSANFPDGGTYTESGEHMQTTVVEVSAAPYAGYAFHRWLENDVTVSRENPYSFTMIDHRTLYLQFRKRLQPDRIFGSDRFQTAIAVSQTGWADNSTDYVLLARSHDFADALAGVPLAYALNAPILLTSTRSISNAVLDEINRLGATHVILLGGTTAIGDEVFNSLTALDLNVERISGNNRYSTAAAIAERLAAETGPLSDAVIAVGTNFPDALAAASYAAYQGQPILLVHNTVLPAATYDALVNLGIQNIVIAGGPGAVSQEIMDALPVPGTKTRVSGSNRYTTSVEMAKHFAPSKIRCFIATGVDFPDAITGAVLAAKENSGILLVYGPRTAPYDSTQDYLVDEGTETITLLGGNSAICFAMEQWF